MICWRAERLRWPTQRAMEVPITAIFFACAGSQARCFALLCRVCCRAGAIFAPYVLLLPFFLPWGHLLGGLQLPA